MSFQVQAGAEGSLSESVHFPPTSGAHEHPGYHMDGRMAVAMAPPLSSASRAPPRVPFLHEDGRGGGGGHYVHSGGFDRAEYDYGMRRHSCGEHLGFHSGGLIEHLLLQENQKALRMASLVHSQASGCLSGCLSCGLSEKRLSFKDSEDRMIAEQRCYSRNVGEGPSRSVNLGAESDFVEYSDGWFRQPRPRQSIGGAGERSQTRISFSEEDLGRSLYQGRRTLYPVSHPTVSHSQASHLVQDQPLHPVGAAESSVPIYGFSDVDGRVRQRWPTQRQTHSENGTEENGWHRSSRSRVGPSSAREQDRLSLPDIATGSLPRNLVGSPHRPAADSVHAAQSTRTTSRSLQLRENSAEPSCLDNLPQQGVTLRVVTQGPVSLTNWYIIKVQISEAGRVLETKVAVGGLLIQSREHVKTSPIVNRLDIHKVVTEDGVEVSLEGTIDQDTSTANGFAPGIVQCLSAGFPYMWKQLLRVRPVGESSSMAVSESLGVLHPKASKCLSDDESQGVIDPKTAKTIPEGMLCSSRDCEGDSPAPAVREEPSLVQTPPSTILGVVESEAPVTVRPGISGVIEPEAVTAPSTLDFVAPQAAVCEEGCLGTVPARAETSDAIETHCSPQDIILQQAQGACITSLHPGPATDSAVPATDAPAPATEAAAPVTEALTPSVEAPVEYLTTDSLFRGAENGSTIDTSLVTIRRGRKKNKGPTHAPLRSSRRLKQRQSSSSEFTLSKVDSLGLAQIEHDTSGMNTTADKSGEEESAQFVQDEKQDPTGCEGLTKTNSIIEQVLQDLQQADTDAANRHSMGMATDPQSMEVEESGQIEDNCENMPKDSDGVKGPELKDTELTQCDSEGVEIEETAHVAPPRMESEEVEETVPAAPELEIEESAPVTPPELLQSKVLSRIGSLSRPSSDRVPQGSEKRVLPEFNARVTRSLKRRLKLTPFTDTAADVAPITRSLKRLRRLSDAATPSVKPPPNLGTTHLEEGTTVEPILNTVPTVEEEDRSAEPDANRGTSNEEEVDAFYVRVRGNRKRSTAKAVNCSNCNQPCSPQDLVEYNSNVMSSAVTPEQAVERVLKVERVDYPPLESQHAAETSGTIEQHDRDQTKTGTVRRRSGRLKKMKPANRFLKIGTSRKLLGDDTRKGSSRGRSLAEHSNKGSDGRRFLGEDSPEGSFEGRYFGEDSGKGSSERNLPGEHSKRGFIEGSGASSSKAKSRRTSIIPPPLPPPRVQDKSKVPEAFGLKTSRSGRLLVPPLAYWRSQSIEYDKDGGIIAIFNGFQAKPADTGCFNFTPPQEKQAKRIQERLWKAAATVKKQK